MSARLSGPKEWRPTPWLESVLLSPKEIHRMRKIRKEAKENKQASLEDTLWMTELVRRLSELGPDDYIFQDFLALVNQITGTAFALGFVRNFDLSSSLLLEPAGESFDVLDRVISINPPQALLVVRPWLRVNGASFPGAVFKLQATILKVIVDNVILVNGPLFPYLICRDGSFFGKTRPIFRARKDDITIYPACRIDENNMADATELEGIFCPNGTRIQATISGKMDGVVDGSFGIVAGLYSVNSGEVSVHGALSAPSTGQIQLPGQLR